MILFTDIGKDIDDAVALAYAVIAGVPLKAVVTTCKDNIASAHIVQNMLDHLSDRFPAAGRVKVFAGSKEPLKKGLEHTNIYKGPFSKSHIIPENLDPISAPSGDAIVIGPLTDLSKMFEHDKIRRAMFMGQARKDHSSLLPDMEAYNMRCDPFASEVCFQYQDTIPLAFIGKRIAYKVPFTKTDFNEIGKINHPVAQFLADHAFTSFDFFKSNVPELYERIYKGTDNLSYCYDPLTMVAIKHPGFFIFEKFGKHRIAADIEADKAKACLLDTIKNGLS